MKNIFKIFVAFVVGLLVVSCTKDEDRAVVGATSNSSLTASTQTVVLSKDNAAKDAITFNWVNPSFGPDIVLTNVLQFALKGTNFKTPKEVEIPAGTTSIKYNVQDFNGLLLATGAPVDANSQIEVRLKSTTASSAIAPVYSPVVSLSATTYALISYVYAPGAYQGWDPATASQLISATSNGIYIGYITFPAGVSDNQQFKITTNRNWSVAYGSNDNVKISTSIGNNITGPIGPQKVTVDLNANTIAFDKYTWGIIGDATPGSWDSDTPMIYDSVAQVWTTTATLSTGGLKFRLNNDWGVNYGGSNGNAVAGGDNINVTAAGTYLITLDLVNMKYTLTKK